MGHSKRKVERDKEPQAREKEKEETLDRVLSILDQHNFKKAICF